MGGYPTRPIHQRSNRCDYVMQLIVFAGIAANVSWIYNWRARKRECELGRIYRSNDARQVKHKEVANIPKTELSTVTELTVTDEVIQRKRVFKAYLAVPTTICGRNNYGGRHLHIENRK